MSIPWMGIFIVCELKVSFRWPPVTTGMLSESLCNYVKIGLSEWGKFYCEIKFFICEITSRLLRDKFFYLRVEFCLLPRGFFLVPLGLFLIASEFSFAHSARSLLLLSECEAAGKFVPQAPRPRHVRE
jgi:hypothetical protein